MLILWSQMSSETDHRERDPCKFGDMREVIFGYSDILTLCILKEGVAHQSTAHKLHSPFYSFGFLLESIHLLRYICFQYTHERSDPNFLLVWLIAKYIWTHSRISSVFLSVLVKIIIHKSENGLSSWFSVVQPEMDDKLALVFQIQSVSNHLIPLFKKWPIPELFSCATGKNEELCKHESKTVW